MTGSDEHEPKGINYRMHPDKIACLRAARFDGCILANNHEGST
jgi:poly-gamma-glutamate synthesis protein (capsule biosynthesis protein)